MKRFSIALKLLLLAGIPVLGALLLAGLVVGTAREQLKKSEALGSVESLAELSEDVSTLAYRLQSERAALALDLGVRTASEGARRDGTPREVPKVDAVFARTDQALALLRGFVATRNMSRLPARLTDGLLSTLKDLGSISRARSEALAGKRDVDAVSAYYAAATARLIRTIAALSELTDDGELLRSITSLVAVLELEERASAEQALLSYVFTTGDFPPGSFRNFMTLLTEEQTYVEVLKTNATREQLAAYRRAMTDPRLSHADLMRQAAVNETDGDFDVAAADWYMLQGAKVDALRTIEQRLNRDVRQRALTKLEDTRRAFVTSSGLAGSALVGSVLLALFIGRGVTRSVRILRDAAYRVGQGVTEVRVDLHTRDELETLGHAFNEMTSELARARDALQERARMARDLEIAARIQSALLPPSLSHPLFEFAGRMRPADEVGGDFYDVLSDKKSGALWVTIGDVSGHGVPAGLVMLMTQSAFAAYFRANPLARPDEVIRGVNDLLSEQIGVRLREHKYVTGLLLTHAGAGRFVYAGAHEWPLVWRAKSGRAEIVEAPGPWLGITSNLQEIPVSTLNLEPGDVLCLYSDGLIEARDDSGDLFDVERLEGALESAARCEGKLEAIADQVLESVADYAHRREDDWTLLLIRRAA